MKVKCNPADLACFVECLPKLTFEPDESIRKGTAENEQGELVIATFGGALGPTNPSKWRYINCVCKK